MPPRPGPLLKRHPGVGTLSGPGGQQRPAGATAWPPSNWSTQSPKRPHASYGTFRAVLKEGEMGFGAGHGDGPRGQPPVLKHRPAFWHFEAAPAENGVGAVIRRTGSGRLAAGSDGHPPLLMGPKLLESPGAAPQALPKSRRSSPAAAGALTRLRGPGKQRLQSGTRHRGKWTIASSWRHVSSSWLTIHPRSYLIICSSSRWPALSWVVVGIKGRQSGSFG